MVNRIATVLFILLITLTGFFVYQNEFAPCKRTVFYDIGNFDIRFGITKEKFLKTIQESEAIWEKKNSSNLFEYKPASKFKINLVFDERQAKTIEAGQSKQEIEGSRAEYDSIAANYKKLAANHEQLLNDYNTQAIEFEAELNFYNSRVAEINNRGGATPKEARELEEEKKRLELEKADLNRQRAVLNNRASELNSLGDTINTLGQKLNINVDVHNQLFGEAREFDQGEYQGNTINIYQFDGIGELRLVFAHEFGHALGIEHVENPKSTMYYLMEKQDIKNPALSQEDFSALKNRCNFD